jgi:hypothetical protein
MPTRKTSKKTTTKSTKSRKTSTAAATSSEEVVMWLRLPRSMNLAELAKLGLKSDPCFGGDTCIAATSMRSDVGIVVQADLEAALDKAGLSRRADPCFGGDTCIV